LVLPGNSYKLQFTKRETYLHVYIIVVSVGLSYLWWVIDPFPFIPVHFPAYATVEPQLSTLGSLKILSKGIRVAEESTENLKEKSRSS